MDGKTKSIFAVMLIIMTLSGIFLYWGIRLYRHHMDEQIDSTVQITGLLIDEVVQNTNKIYVEKLNTILGRNAILEAFHQKNREKLYHTALDFHKALIRDHVFYSNMHFHLPTGFSFLRMHKPEEFGDDLRTIRPIIMQVHQNKKEISGYEIGKHGLFFRIAKPVFYKGEYIGALEIGIKAKQAAENIERILNIKVARIIPDEYLNDAFRNLRIDEIIQDGLSINPYENSAAFKDIIGSLDLNGMFHGDLDVNTKKSLIFSSGNLLDYKKNTIARFLVIKDISKNAAEYTSFLTQSFFLTLVLILGAFIILHFSFGSYINRIIVLNRTLEKKVAKRTQNLVHVTDVLRQTNAELDQIFSTSTDGMRVIDKDFRVIRMNDTLANIIGKEPEHLLFSACHQYFQGPFCFTENCTLKRILNGETRIEMNVVKQTPSGEKRSYNLTATPFKSSNGELLGVVENFRDITESQKIFKTLEDSENYLKTIMSTVRAGVIITDDKSPLIIDANPHALKMIGLQSEDLSKVSIRDHIKLEKPWIDYLAKTDEAFQKDDFILKRSNGELLNIRLSIARVEFKGKTLLVQSFSDITDVKKLINKQMVDIHKAKAIMELINPEPARYTSLPGGLRLFCRIWCIPCNAEGGDHAFIKNLTLNGCPETHISIKDQSGHEVNCILRSIYTDLVHNAIMVNAEEKRVDQVTTRLNAELHDSGFFEPDDFFTAVNAAIDHNNMTLDYVSVGHPPFLLIRENDVQLLPDDAHGIQHLPIPFLKNTAYRAQKIQLQENDQLIFFTDGLLEMPTGRSEEAITYREFADLVQDLLTDLKSPQEGITPVSELTSGILDRVCALSRETVRPAENGTDAVNSSDDDVTLVGIEIEPVSARTSLVLKPKKSEDITVFISNVLKSIFAHPENEPFSHLQYRIRAVLEEALLNAWKHGNRMGPEKEILFGFSSRNDFVFEIADQGKGFDFQNISDPTGRENITRTSGRGIFIIRHFSDHVRWEGNGNQLIICIEKKDKLDDREDFYVPQSHLSLWQNQ